MTPRKYRSPLREEQAQRTRQRLIEAAADLTLFDFSLLTHANVARSAGVAERTVFRHFPTVAALHDAFATFQEQRFAMDQSQDLSIDDVPEAYERWPERLAGTGLIEELTKREESPAVTKSRRKRYARLERALRELVPDATETQLQQLALVFGALASPEVFRRGKMILGLDPEAIVPGPAWAMRVLIERLRNGDGPWK